MDTSRASLTQALAKTEATSPVMSYETMITPLLIQAAAKPAATSSPGPSNKPEVCTSGYVTFPPYHRTLPSKAQIAKNYVRKAKTSLITASDELLNGLEAVGNFYAYSEQKWETEYQSFERMTSNTSAWEAIDAADKAALLEKTEKRQQKSWGKRWQNYWRPEPAGESSKSGIITHGDGKSAKNKEFSIPPISKDLRKQNKQRPERKISSYQPKHPLRKGRTQERTVRIPLTRKPHFSPPRGRMHPLERQHSRAHQIPEQQALESNEEDEEDLGTPWSGLETVAEEHFWGEETWGEKERMRGDEGIGAAEGEGDYEREGKREREDGEEDCDGFEAGGELCLRHESCIREAMAIGGA